MKRYCHDKWCKREAVGYVDMTLVDGMKKRIYLCQICVDAFRLGQSLPEAIVESLDYVGDDHLYNSQGFLVDAGGEEGHGTKD